MHFTFSTIVATASMLHLVAAAPQLGHLKRQEATSKIAIGCYGADGTYQEYEQSFCPAGTSNMPKATPLATSKIAIGCYNDVDGTYKEYEQSFCPAGTSNSPKV